jgi:large subunit ribosomal protein L24e
MVIKYQTCSFSEYKIAPGHGIRYAEVNGKTHIFITKKVRSLARHAKKPLNIRWTLKWRTSHKKGKVEESKNKASKQKKEKQVKAIVGLSLEEINRIRESMKEERTNDAQRYKYAQEIKDKRKKYLEKIRRDRPQADKFAQKNVKQNIPKGAQARA